MRFRGNGFSYFLLENSLKKLKNYKKLKFIATVRKFEIKCFTKCGLLETKRIMIFFITKERLNRIFIEKIMKKKTNQYGDHFWIRVILKVLLIFLKIKI